ncbi:dihydrofolate reductase family protein [Deinococcus sp.]|uniref:dihydrofolate reductase family protein n=1 Tax=Deinococcus sp. TaxID=47478 RepID=UPI002869D056|nr:dihydrofolate reductase family protein [Deinococcus sp.]
MGTVLLSMFVSLDGFVNDPQGRVGPLYPDPAALDQTAFMQDSIRTTGAVVMGRRAFDMGKPDEYVGQYEYQVPIFVLTHHPPAVPPKQDERLTFTFVDSVGDAVTQAKVVAGDRDVLIIGGADTAQQALNAGVVDELEVGVAPVLLGGGTPLFANLVHPFTLERTQITDLLGTPILRYRVGHTGKESEERPWDT